MSWNLSRRAIWTTLLLLISPIWLFCFLIIVVEDSDFESLRAEVIGGEIPDLLKPAITIALIGSTLFIIKCLIEVLGWQRLAKILFDAIPGLSVSSKALDVLYSELLSDVKTIEDESNPDEPLISFLMQRTKLAAKREELAMIRSEARANSLYRVGFLLLIVSVFCPLAAGLAYVIVEPLPADTVTRLTQLNNELGALPSGLTIQVARDWHVLVAGITLGFLCLAAARGVLGQQSQETRQFFRLNERVNYYERLRSVLEIKARQLGEEFDSEDDLVALVVTHLLDEPPASHKEAETPKEQDLAEASKILQLTKQLRN